MCQALVPVEVEDFPLRLRQGVDALVEGGPGREQAGVLAAGRRRFVGGACPGRASGAGSRPLPDRNTCRVKSMSTRRICVAARPTNSRTEPGLTACRAFQSFRAARWITSSTSSQRRTPGKPLSIFQARAVRRPSRHSSTRSRAEGSPAFIRSGPALQLAAVVVHRRNLVAVSSMTIWAALSIGFREGEKERMGRWAEAAKIGHRPQKPADPSEFRSCGGGCRRSAVA